MSTGFDSGGASHFCGVRPSKAASTACTLSCLLDAGAASQPAWWRLGVVAHAMTDPQHQPVQHT